MKPILLYLDQYGNKFWAKTVKELRAQINNGHSRVSIMYCDKKDGRSVRTGYVIGQHWLTAYVRVERSVIGRIIDIKLVTFSKRHYQDIEKL